MSKRKHRFYLLFLLFLFGYLTACGTSSSGGAEQGASQEPPQGREAKVEEADLYRMRGDMLFYLNTYKGLTVFDLQNPKQPKKLANLPVFGYPVEMYVEKNTVFALVRDVLYLSESQGKFEFKRRQVSQLVSVDISNPKHPKILQRIDIKGKIHEGVSRKIENIIYVASYQPTSYSYGWYQPQLKKQAQVSVHSFDIKNSKKIKRIQQIDLIKQQPDFSRGKFLNPPKPTEKELNSLRPDASWENNLRKVTISATSNTLMIVENWNSYLRQGCAGRTQQFSKVNLIDVSDPKGTIRLHSKFQIRGLLDDQFKQTYIYEKKKKKAFYLGIFRRFGRNDENQGLTHNNLFSIDVTNGTSPRIISTLEFGKANETVRGSLFDLERKVVYAITAVEQRDPLYAMSFADPSNLEILSQIDRLSGSINLFRFVGKKRFLMAIGEDNTEHCTGFESDPPSGQPRRTQVRQVSVSVVDVRDLKKIRLVQRKCVTPTFAASSSSQVNQNRDQAHKMIGMYSDSEVNLLTVPFNYWGSQQANGWGYYLHRTAIAVMKWDLSKYDDTKDERHQSVLENITTLHHPKGHVKRTVIFNSKNEKGQNKRLVLNLSDSDLSLMDLSNLTEPKNLSSFEIAPYIRSIHRFGDYIVEQASLGKYATQYNEFRVKRISSKNINDAPILSKFTVGQISQAIRWKHLLLLSTGSVLRIYDFNDPTHPVARGQISFLFNFGQYNPFYCGSFSHYYSALRSQNIQWLETEQGFALFRTTRYQNKDFKSQIAFLDLRDPSKPKYEAFALGNKIKQKRWPVTLLPIRGSKKMFFTLHRHNQWIDQSKKQTHELTLWSLQQGKWKQGNPLEVHSLPFQAYTTKNQIRILSRNTPVKKSNRLELYSYETKSNKLKPLHSFTASEWELSDLILDPKRDILYITMNRPKDHPSRKVGGQKGYKAPEYHLGVFDLSQDLLKEIYFGNTKITNMKLLGIKENRLFIKLRTDGILVTDMKNIGSPKGIHFERTLGWTTHIEFDKDYALIAAGHYGIYKIDLTQSTLPTD